MNRNDEEYKWLVNLVQDRNQHLNLSFEQAEKLNQYEETDFEFTNVWDEIERDKKFMKSILNDAQFQIYQAELERRIKIEEDSIKRNSNNSLKQIKYLIDQKELTEEEYIPKMRMIREEFDKVFSNQDRQIVNNLIQNYKLLIEKRRAKFNKEIDVHTKGLNQDAYKESDLRIDIDELIPTPRIFELNKDDEKILVKLKEIIKKYDDAICYFLNKTKGIERNYWNKNNDLLNQHFSLNKEPQGWKIEIVKEEEETEFDRKFAFLMLKSKNGA